MIARRWILIGRVQGVGYRPFVYRLAQSLGLSGWVQNQVGQVEIVAQGSPATLDAFGHGLLAEAPPLAAPRILLTEPVALLPHPGFAIRPSSTGTRPRIHVPPDFFTCEDCLRELHDRHDRRYRYPFINCTQCGPRYTLIARMPYDRPNTSMAAFPLCPDCGREYANPLDRRFHAEPVACPACGPRLRFVATGAAPLLGNEAALAAAVASLAAGNIVAVQGIGGYHLMCVARSSAAIGRLRASKPRPHKPLALMFPTAGDDDLEVLRRYLQPTDVEARWLRSPMRPIVLVRSAAVAELPALVAPGLTEIGAMLPYSPLHHLLLDTLGTPLVATSGNVSGEPVLTDPTTVEQRLGQVAQAFLHHDRPILRPADDPVYRVIAGRARPLRLGRGNAPLELDLPGLLPYPVLAVGAHMKNTVALAWEDRVVVSPHIGDMGTLRSLEVFEAVVSDLQTLYGIRARAVVHDAHPGYATTRWAARSGLPALPVFHHHAHASALVGEATGPTEPWLIFTWDGVGFGEDGSLWGGDTLLGLPGAWRRVARLRPFRLPGGERAGREPWRSAAALCWETGRPWRSSPALELLHRAWRQGLNAPRTTAAGRLFDAATALTGLLETASFEGQGPMYLEAVCGEDFEALELPLTSLANGCLQTDWEPLLPMLQNEALPVSTRSARFHASLARALVAQAQHLRGLHGVTRVGLCGGVFQNRVLAERALAGLAAAGFAAFLPERIPVNDAGISYGQVLEISSRLR